nr:hypothetical protein [Escherichia coli]
MLDKRRLVAVKSPVTTDLTVVANIDRAKALLERKSTERRRRVSPLSNQYLPGSDSAFVHIPA